MAKMTSIRTLAALATSRGLQLYQMDFNNAFLNGDLEKEVYMVHPLGYADLKYLDRVCRLKKFLYRLKQAPGAWNAKINSFLLSLGFSLY